MLFTKLYNAQGIQELPYLHTFQLFIHATNVITFLFLHVECRHVLICYLFVALFSTLYCELFIFSLLLVLIYEFVYYLHTQNVPLP